MDRAEKTGLGVAVAGHLALFGVLSVGFLATPNPIDLKPRPIEVTLADEAGLVSEAPDPSTEAPAERLAPEEGPVEPLPTPPAPLPEPQPLAKPQPVRPAPAPRPTPKPVQTPPKPRQAAQPMPKPRQQPAQKTVRPTGRLTGITDGLADRPTNSKSTQQQASRNSAQARKSIDVAIDQAIRPFWRPPTGVDADQLGTVLEIQLNKNGGLAGEPRLVTQRGKTDSNAPQQTLHVERAIKAIKLAAPFKLPPDYYDQWKTWRLEFDTRL